MIDLLNQSLVKPDGVPALPSFHLPNIKELILPDHGYVMVDCDLSQADAQVVAWEANDDILKDIFRDPDADLHTINAEMIFGSCPSKKHPNRRKAKAGVHAVNYNVYPTTLAKALGISVKEAESFINRWFDIHPNIKEWQNRIKQEMMEDRRIANAFGFEKKFFDRRDGKTALSEALAWIPQSTVALVINKVWDRLAKYPNSELFISMQVHDSLVFQVKRELLPSYMNKISEAFQVVVPYSDPLVIGASIEVGSSYGGCKPVSWDGYVLDSEGKSTGEKHIYLKNP